MDFVFTIKLALIAIIALLLSYFVLNAVLAFISKFSEQLRKLTKNVLVAAGAAYMVGLLVAPVYIFDLSMPLIRLAIKIAPKFLNP